MQTQDFKYISFKRSQELAKIEKLKASLHLISIKKGKNRSKRIVFEENEEETPEKKQQSMDFQHQLEYQFRDQTKMYRELEKREERARQLTLILQDMTHSRMTANSKNREGQKVVNDNKNCIPLLFPAERLK